MLIQESFLKYLPNLQVARGTIRPAMSMAGTRALAQGINLLAPSSLPHFTSIYAVMSSVRNTEMNRSTTMQPVPTNTSAAWSPAWIIST